MSLSVEGGEFQCYIHNFRTANIDDWNNHCTNEEGHYEQGHTACITCGERIEFTDLPFHPIVNGLKNIQLRCDDCDTKMRGKAKVTKLTNKETNSNNKGKTQK